MYNSQSQFSKFADDALTDMTACLGGKWYPSTLASGQSDMFDPSSGDNSSNCCENDDLQCEGAAPTPDSPSTGEAAATSSTRRSG